MHYVSKAALPSLVQHCGANTSAVALPTLPRERRNETENKNKTTKKSKVRSTGEINRVRASMIRWGATVIVAHLVHDDQHPLHQRRQVHPGKKLPYHVLRAFRCRPCRLRYAKGHTLKGTVVHRIERGVASNIVIGEGTRVWGGSRIL